MKKHETGSGRQTLKSAVKVSTAQERHTMDTFNRHVKAFRSGSVQAVLRDFAEDAIVMTPDGVYAGKDQIRNLYEGLLAEFGDTEAGDSPGIMVDVLHVKDDTVFCTWHAESIHQIFGFGADTMLIADEMIKRQTVAFTPPQMKH
ncbi:MAG: nuclear transport factor 2 family protein [Pseudomonadota bacterium]